MIEFDYNRRLAVEYARRWALGRNPDFYDFNDIGGDCTNFCSQCIYAGSGVMNYTPTFGWYYISLNNRAPAWTGVMQLYNFIVSNEGLGPFGKEVSRSEVLPGDFLQLGRGTDDFYHSPFISKIQNGRIYVCAHTYDALDRPLDTYNYEKVRFVHIIGVRSAY